MKKKIVSCLLAASMVASMFAGCGDTKEEANNQEQETVSQEGTTESEGEKETDVLLYLFKSSSIAFDISFAFDLVLDKVDINIVINNKPSIDKPYINVDIANPFLFSFFIFSFFIYITYTLRYYLTI